MQSGYGGVSEMQQFLVDGCPPTLFSISTQPPPPPDSAADIHTAASTPTLKYHPHHQPQPQHQHQPPPPLQFPHFHHIPITQQLFQQPHHQFQLFHPHQQHAAQPEQRRMIPHQHHHHHHQQQQQSGRENSCSPIGSRGGEGGGPPSFLAAAINFKLAVNESSGGGSQEGLNDDEGILHGDDGSESRFHPWQREEEAGGIKEPFWRPLDIDYIDRSNKRCKEKEPESSTNAYCKKSKEGSEPGQGNPTVAGGTGNYKLFSELEAIYKPGSSTTTAGGGSHHPQTGSGSALTGDENPLITAAVELPPGVPHAVDRGSDTSTGGGGEAPPASKYPKSGGRRKRKRRQQQQLSSITAFLDRLVKQLMDHQEGLHRKFLEVMERRDQERTCREEAWRRQEAGKWSREAAARTEERALAAAREAAIVSFLEKLTGESLNLPTKLQFPPEKDDDNTDNNPIELIEPADPNADSHSNRIQLSSSRWPRAEVQALIRVRSGLEPRFQEPGLKGPLWEEVSSTMASLGYSRNSKRCKEKWENINKYFRKTKDSGKKRPQQSKTCPYFHQLDQLYSKTPPIKLPLTANPAGDRRVENSELLDAIVDVPTEHPTFKLPDGFNAAGEGDNAKPIEEDEGRDEEEGDGEGQGLWQQRVVLHP